MVEDVFCCEINQVKKNVREIRRERAVIIKIKHPGMSTKAQILPQGYELILQTCLLSLLLLVVVVGNSLISAIVWKFKNLRTHANVFVVEMAVTDFMNGAINIPMFICYQLYPSPSLRGRTVAMVCLFIRRGCLLQNLLSVSTIFMDRYLAFAYGVRYTAWKNRKTIFIAIAVKWVIGCAIVGFIILFHTEFEEMGDVAIFRYIQQYEDNGIMPFPRIILPSFLVLFCVVSFLSTREIRKNVTFRKGIEGLRVKKFQDLKALITVRYIIVAYAICILPGVTRSILIATTVVIIEHWLLFFEFFFLLVTCAINCAIYYIRTERFRRALVVLFINPKQKNLVELKAFDKVVPRIVREAKKLEQLEFADISIGPEDQAQFTTVTKSCSAESKDVVSRETEESVNLPDDDEPSSYDTKF